MLSVVSYFHWVIIEIIANIYWMLIIEGTGTSYIVSILMLTSEVDIILLLQMRKLGLKKFK